MPHLAYTEKNETDTIEYHFPMSMGFKDLFSEVEMSMVAEGFENGCSGGTIRNIWKQYYQNYKFHKKGGAFAICDACVKFKDRLGKERVHTIKAKLEEQRSDHLKEQMSGRNLYYSY